MTHTEAKEKFGLVETPLTDMEVAELAKKTTDNFITVHVVQSFDDIVDLGRADDYNDPILARCFETELAMDISYNIVGLIERPDHDGGNDVVVAVTCDVSEILSQMDSDEGE